MKTKKKNSAIRRDDIVADEAEKRSTVCCSKRCDEMEYEGPLRFICPVRERLALLSLPSWYRLVVRKRDSQAVQHGYFWA